MLTVFIILSSNQKNESLLEYLNRCEEQVKRWPKWKIESIRDAFGLNTIKGKQAGTI